MVQLYPPLHTAAILIKKQFLSCVALLAAAAFLQTDLQAQCTPPPAPVVIPNPAVVCINNGPLRLAVQPTAVASQFCSGSVYIAVPDNNVAGASSSVTVAGIPAACSISNIAVSINMQHSRIGDMIFVLKAPNGQIINLDYQLSGTANNMATTGFINTVISSSGITALSTGNNTWTGTFKADLANATAIPPAGPTGFAPTTTSWTGLFGGGIANGNWTLAFYDATSGETGTLNSWCLNFTFNCINSNTTAPAEWFPPTGLYRDAACTVPYIAGTLTDTVYTMPLIPGTYTYQVTHSSIGNPACVSAPTSVNVIAGILSAITMQPADQEICLGNDAQFSVAATGTGLIYQWQVSTNGGASFTNLVNTGIFSGANTATLKITQPPLGMSGQKYRVVVSSINACGSTLSNAALLTVNPKPAISFYAHPYHLLSPGLTTTLSAVLTPANSAATYSWMYNGAVLPGATADSLLVDFAHIGLYQVSVTDTNGCSAVSDTMSIRDSALGIMFMYPNPSDGRFQVRLYSTPGISQPRVITVYNSMGNKVVVLNYDQTNPYQQVFVDIRKNGKGIYWVEVADKNGQRISLSRILIQ
ncbi:MAG: T9SS type A sorting domain-containing protein [Ferruginibacter sp.]